MFARVVSLDITPDVVETYRSMIREKVIPAVRQSQGFKGGYWLIDTEGHSALGVALFESKAALDASDGVYERLQEELRGTGMPIPSFKKCEVVESISETQKLAA